MSPVERIRESLRNHGLGGFALLCLKIPLSPLLKSQLGIRLTSAYQGWVFDRRFGVNTAGWISQPVPCVPGRDPRLGSSYDGSTPPHFNRIVGDLKINYEDYTFVDFGSGKGRVLLLAGAFPFRRVIGVEWSKELHEVARRNLNVYRGPRACHYTESYCMDARDFPIPSGKTVLYFFNPFKHEIMSRVLHNIKRSFDTDPREIILIYMNPRFKRILDRADFLERTADRGWFAVYATVCSVGCGEKSRAREA
jgi:SAM-dependent methyltransferase